MKLTDILKPHDTPAVSATTITPDMASDLMSMPPGEVMEFTVCGRTFVVIDAEDLEHVMREAHMELADE